MREIDLFNLNDKLTEPELICDVACLLYDSTDDRSFEYIARIFLKHFVDCKLPILIVASKSDSPPVKQNYPMQPEEFCALHKLAPPHPFTLREALLPEKREVYSKVATMAAYPNLKRLVHVLCMRPTPTWFSSHFGYVT